MAGRLKVDSRTRRRSLLIDAKQGTHRVELYVEDVGQSQELLIENCSFVSNGRMDGMAAFDNSGGALALRVSRLARSASWPS